MERNASEPPTLGGALQRRDCKGGPGVLSNCDKSHPVVSSRFSAQPAVPTGGKADVPSETAIGVIEKGLIVDHPFDRLAFMMCGRAVLKAMPSSAARRHRLGRRVGGLRPLLLSLVYCVPILLSVLLTCVRASSIEMFCARAITWAARSRASAACCGSPVTRATM